MMNKGDILMNLKNLIQILPGALLGLSLVIGAGDAAAKAVEGVVNVNTATEAELTLLPGIGKAKAQEIIQIRQAKPFAAPEELKAIKGLGAKRFEAIAPHVTVTGPTTAKAVAAPKPAAASPAAPVANVSPVVPTAKPSAVPTQAPAPSPSK